MLYNTNSPKNQSNLSTFDNLFEVDTETQSPYNNPIFFIFFIDPGHYIERGPAQPDALVAVMITGTPVPVIVMLGLVIVPPSKIKGLLLKLTTIMVSKNNIAIVESLFFT